MQTPQGQVSSEEFYKQLGWSGYTSLDISDKWGSLPTDLNWEPGERDGHSTLLGIFDLVTNNGTGEHIFNQASVFEWMHKLCAVNGVMVHVLPWTGYVNHGFYSYHPVLFRDLAGANGYEILGMYAGERDGTMRQLDDWGYHHPKPFKEPVTPVETTIRAFGDRANVFVVAILKKTVDGMFAYPTQGKYAGEAQSFAKVKDLSEVPTILDRIGEIETDPFPHVVVENALPEEFYNQLAESFPDWTKIVPEGAEAGTLHHLKAAKAIYDGSLDPVWRRFILRHTEASFGARWLETFGEHVRPMMERMPQGDLKLGVRGTGDFDLVLDCQIAVNAPGGECLTRGAHLDSSDELLAALLYMPVDGDDAGGDLEIYRWVKEPKLVGKAEAAEGTVEYVKTVPYKPNQLIVFVNDMNSLHGLTVRQSSAVPRRYVNFVLNANRPVREEPPR